jgi:hypothetical protein
VKSVDQRVFVFSVTELSEALAAYVQAKTGEKLLDMQTMALNLDPTNAALIWTLTRLDTSKLKPGGDA